MYVHNYEKRDSVAFYEYVELMCQSRGK